MNVAVTGMAECEDGELKFPRKAAGIMDQVRDL